MSTAGVETLRRVSRESTASIIAAQLQQAIMSGSLAPGTQLAETELATRLGVSRGPLREAMQRLIQQGLLRSEPHRGLFVVTLDEEDIRDIYLARTAIETAAARLVLARDAKGAARRLGRIADSMAGAATKGDWVRLTAADMEFHQTLIKAAQSRRLVRMSEGLLVETRICMNALRDKYPAPLDMSDEHAALVAAIADRDEARLVALIDTHMRDAVDRLITGPPGAEAASS